MGTCLVGGGSDHSPGSGTAHHDGSTAQLGSAQQLDRDEERIHVDVEDGARPPG